jgi:hypothetical protein
MKKRIVSIIVVISIFSCFGFTQTFEKYYRTNMDDIVYTAVSLDDNKVIFPLSSGDYNGNYISKLYKMDIFTGEFIDSSSVISAGADYSLSSVGFISLIADSSIVITASATEYLSGDIQLFIGILNSALELQFDTIVGDNSISDVFSDTKIINDQLICTGCRNPYGPRHTVVYVTDLEGNFIKEKEYFGQGQLGSTLVDLPGQKFHLYQYWDTNHSFNIIDKNTLETDTIIPYPLGYLPRNSIVAPDSGVYYVAGRQYDLVYPPQLGSFLSYLKVSDNGQTIQQFNFEMDDEVTYYTNQSFDYNSGNIYFGGGYPCTWVPSFLFYPEARYILLNKISHDGELIWQNFYKGDVNYMPFKILATSDGGALIFSTRYDWNDPIPNQRDVHILKIDSTGYYSPITGTEEVVDQPRQILVYPNPVKDKLHFVFGLYSDLTISIYDAAGREMISETYHRSPTLDLSGFKKGLYLYRITGARGLIEKGKIIKE